MTIAERIQEFLAGKPAQRMTDICNAITSDGHTFFSVYACLRRLEKTGEVQRVARGLYIGKSSTPSLLAKRPVAPPPSLTREEALANYNRTLLNLSKIQARLRGIEEERAQLLQSQPVAENEVDDAREMYEAVLLRG